MDDPKIEQFVEMLKTEEILCQTESISAYSSDASFITLGEPSLIIFPKTTEEVLKVVTFAVKNNIALTPRAKGSSTAGASLATEGGVIIMTDRLGVIDKFGKRSATPLITAVGSEGNEIALDDLTNHKTEELYARVGTGVTTEELDKLLSKYGWQTAVVPSSGWSTIGGNFSTNAGGNGTPKYGTYANVINQLKLVVSTDNGAELKTLTDREKIKSLGGGQGLYGIITELDVRITPKLSEDDTLSVVCTCKTADIESLGDKIGDFMVAMEEVTSATIAEFMMADKSIFKDDDPLLGIEEIRDFFTYNDGDYKFLTMYQGKKDELTGLKGVAEKFTEIEYHEISTKLFKTMLDLRKAATGKSPGRVAMPGFEDIYVKDPKYLGKVLKAIYSITEGSLPGRPIGHQYTGGLVIHYRPTAAGTKKDYAEAWRLNEKLTKEICTDKYQTVKRREHGLGLELYSLATPEERQKIEALKKEFDPANIFQPHIITENPKIDFIGEKFTELSD
jgi:FAD/FMN-containing dehydrogenase